MTGLLRGLNNVQNNKYSTSPSESASAMVWNSLLENKGWLARTDPELNEIPSPHSPVHAAYRLVSGCPKDLMYSSQHITTNQKILGERNDLHNVYHFINDASKGMYITQKHTFSQRQELQTSRPPVPHSVGDRTDVRGPTVPRLAPWRLSGRLVIFLELINWN